MSAPYARPGSAMPPAAAKPRAAARARPASALPGANSAPAAAAAQSGARQGRPPRASEAGEARGGQRGSQSEMSYFHEQVLRLQQQEQELKALEQEETAQYRRQLRRFYNGNAVLRNIIASAERRARHDGELDADAPANVTEAEVQHLQYRINLARRRQNRLLHDLKLASTVVEKDKAAEAEAMKTAQLSRAEMMANRPAFLRKHRLERQLNDVLTQQQVIDAVMKGYTHHLDELHQEGLHYDAQMRTVEKELKDRHRDQMQLVTLFRNAKKEYQSVAQECTEFLLQFEGGRAAKDKALREKRDTVEQQLDVTRDQASRLTVLEQQIEEEAQLMESAENVEAQLEADRIGTRNALAVLSGGGGGATTSATRGTATVQEEEKLSAYEKLFRALMEKAKVSEPDDLVQVFETELQGQVAMIDEVEQRRIACAQLRDEVRELRAKVDDARLCGLSRQPVATPALEAELAKFIHEEQTRLMQSVHHQQETETNLTELVRRIDAVARLMSGYRPDVAIPPLETSRSAMFLLHTAVLTQKVLALADETVQGHGTRQGVVTTVAPPVTVRSTQLVIPANNVRVPLEAQDQNAVGGHRGGKAAGTIRRTSQYGQGGGAVAGVSSGAGARLLDLRRTSRGTAAARYSVDSANFAGNAGKGLTEDYGFAMEASGTTSGAHDESDSDSSEEGDVVASGGPSLLASTATPRRPTTVKKSATGLTCVTTAASAHSGVADASNTDDDPLRRDDIKRMSEALLRRQKKREEQAQRRQNKSTM